MIYSLDLKEYKAYRESKGRLVGDLSWKQKNIEYKVLQSLQYGFIYVEHGLDQTFIDDVYRLLEKFFSLDDSDKNSNSMFAKLGSEKAESSEVPDFKEMLNWTMELPHQHPLQEKYPHRFKPFDAIHLPKDILVEFSERVFSVQKEVLSVIASALGVHETFFDRMVTHGPTMTRALHYPIVENKEIWAEEHDDINLITALPRATASGLQIKINNRWVDAAPPEGAMIINTGLMMEHITNGVIPSGRHRVAADGKLEERYSVVQFCHPTPGTILAPMGVCITPKKPQKYDSVTADEMLSEVIYRITHHNS